MKVSERAVSSRYVKTCSFQIPADIKKLCPSLSRLKIVLGLHLRRLSMGWYRQTISKHLPLKYLPISVAIGAQIVWVFTRLIIIIICLPPPVYAHEKCPCDQCIKLHLAYVYF